MPFKNSLDSGPKGTHSGLEMVRFSLKLEYLFSSNVSGCVRIIGSHRIKMAIFKC